MVSGYLIKKYLLGKKVNKKLKSKYGSFEYLEDSDFVDRRSNNTRRFYFGVERE